MANPIIKRTELAVGQQAMTTQGVVRKTTFMLALTAITGIGFFFYAAMSGMSTGLIRMIAFGSMFAAFGLGLFLTFKPQMAKTLAVPYALLEGVFLGGISLFFMSYFPTVPLTALCATFVTAALMLGLYRSGIIKVTQKFRSIMTSAILAIMVLYVIQWIMRLAFGSSIPFLFDGGMIAIGFSIFVVLIASFSLLLDFDGVERGVKMGVSEDYEWIFSVGILASLVWMYVEFMRLLSYLQD